MPTQSNTPEPPASPASPAPPAAPLQEAQPADDTTILNSLRLITRALDEGRVHTNIPSINFAEGEVEHPDAAANRDSAARAAIERFTNTSWEDNHRLVPAQEDLPRPPRAPRASAATRPPRNQREGERRVERDIREQAERLRFEGPMSYDEYLRSISDEINNNMPLDQLPLVQMPRFQEPLTFHSPRHIGERKFNKSNRFLAVEIEVAGVRKVNRLTEVIKGWSASVVSDGSLPEYGFEINTSPASADRFIKQIEEICDALKQSGGYVTDKCGLHVHVDARDLTYYGIRRLLRIYSALEPLLFQMIPSERRNSRYCQPCAHEYRKVGKLTNYVTARKDVMHAVYHSSNTRRSKREKYNGSRYMALNAHSWYYRGTVECRLLDGTVDPNVIVPWGMFWAKLVDFAANATDKEIDVLTESPYLDRIGEADRTYSIAMENSTIAYNANRDKAKKNYDKVNKPLEEKMYKTTNDAEAEYSKTSEEAEAAYRNAISNSENEIVVTRHNAEQAYFDTCTLAKSNYNESAKAASDRVTLDMKLRKAEAEYNKVIEPTESKYAEIVTKAQTEFDRTVNTAREKCAKLQKESERAYQKATSEARLRHRTEISNAETHYKIDQEIIARNHANETNKIAEDYRFAVKPDSIEHAAKVLNTVLPNRDLVRTFIVNRVVTYGDTSTVDKMNRLLTR